MKKLTEKEKKERGWYWVGGDMYYWRTCDNCGEEYRGMGRNFCSRKCSANLKLVEKEDGTVSIELKRRSVGHNYGKLISKAKRGKPNPRLSGSLHHNWKGGVSRIRKSERRNLMVKAEYREWRRLVFERDNFQCVICHIDGQLQAHHVYNWADYPKLRYCLDNGVTVCNSCHPRGRVKERKMVEVFNKIIKNNSKV